MVNCRYFSFLLDQIVLKRKKQRNHITLLSLHVAVLCYLPSDCYYSRIFNKKEYLFTNVCNFGGTEWSNG